MLQEVSGQKDYKLNPVGWCTNMVGANFAEITKVFGDKATSRMNSCEFHFKDHKARNHRDLATIVVTASKNFAIHS